MPIDKIEEQVKPTDVDPTSKMLDIHFNKRICCSICGSSIHQLKRVRDADGNKIRPAKYICVECAKIP